MLAVIAVIAVIVTGDQLSGHGHREHQSTNTDKKLTTLSRIRCRTTLYEPIGRLASSRTSALRICAQSDIHLHEFLLYTRDALRCPQIATCELFPYFKRTPMVRFWKSKYC
ncbi:MAG: hypothetical protein AAGC55_28900, partial [Myxococcota bacterium]